jgi:hypothetical protein
VYARVVDIENVDSTKRELAVQAIRERVLPTMHELDGFSGLVTLVDPDRGHAWNIQLWDTREHAEAAENHIAPIRAQLSREVGVTVRAAVLYEAPIVQLIESARA